MRGFVGLVSRGNAVQGSWVSPSKDDECMDNKIYSESFIENILPTKYLYDMIVISAKYSFISLLLHFN